MNKITHEGNDYEVLSLDPESIKQITHAMLAGGKVVEATCIDRLYIRVGVPMTPNDCHVYYSDELEDNNIQPLKLLEKVPVEFVGEVVKEDLGVRDDWVIYAPEEYIGKRFRCVEVVEVTK